MGNVEMELSPIMELPEEVRTVIFNLIPQKETLNLRLVCKIWNKEIQNNYEYDIKKLDEDSPYFQSILQLRIKKLRIHKLETTPVFNFDGTSIFKHPNEIQTLGIESDSLIPQLNLQMLIGLFSENLRKLYITVTPKIYSFQFPSDLFFNFNKLKYFSSVTGACAADCEENPRSMFQVLENSSFPNLMTVYICLSGLEMRLEAESRMVGNLLRMISKNGKYLEEIHIELDSEHPVPLQEKELLLLDFKQIQTVKKVNIFVLPKILGTDEFWDEVFGNQKQLEDIEIIRFSWIFSVSLIQQITLNNSATLRKLEIRGIHLSPTDRSIDLLIFQNCLGLKELTLSMKYDAMIARKNSEKPDLINFQCLPQNIIDLELERLKVLSGELLMAFRSNDNTGNKGFKKLEDLTLCECGNEGPVGVNAVVLYEIMMTPRPSLRSVDFEELHKGGPAMKTVLNQLQIPEDTNDVMLRRASGELVWK